MEKQKVNNPDEPSNHSFTMVPDFFYRRLIKVMGAIPSLLYLCPSILLSQEKISGLALFKYHEQGDGYGQNDHH